MFALLFAVILFFFFFFFFKSYLQERNTVFDKQTFDITVPKNVFPMYILQSVNSSYACPFF